MLVLMQGIPQFKWAKSGLQRDLLQISQKARDWKKLLDDSLSQYLAPDIKIYDTTKNGEAEIHINNLSCN